MLRHKRLGSQETEELERYRLIAGNLPDSVFIFDLKGKITSVNDVHDIFGLGPKKEELVGKSLLEFVSEKYWSMISEDLKDLAEGKPTHGEIEVKSEHGLVMVELRSTPIKKKGRIVGFLSIVRDVTKRKRMMEELRGSEEKYRLMFENSPDGIITLDHTGNITSVNDVILSYGYKREELVGKNWLEFIQGNYRSSLDEHVSALTKGVSTQGEAELGTPKGRLQVWFMASPVKRSGEIVGFQIFLIDITERKRMEEELRESGEKFRDLYEGIHDPVAIYVGKEGRLVDYNLAFKKLIGYTDEELKRKTIMDLAHPDDRDMVLEKYRTDFPEDKFPVIFEVRAINKSGEAVYLEASVNPYKKKGKVIGVEVINRDISERKRMEEELRESGEKFRDLYESVPDALAVYVGREGHLIECNRAFQKWSGYTDEELKGKVFLDFVHPDDRALVMEKYRTKYSENEFPIIYEIRTVNKKGESHPTEISVGPYRKKGRIIGINVMHRDITERVRMREKLDEYSQHLETLVEKRTCQLKETQEQLVKSERLAAVGQAAAMVGHDLRNPLTGINSAAYYLKMKLGPEMSKEIRETLELIEKDILYSNKIITDLMEFSREIRLELTETTPKSIMKDSLSLVEIPKKVQVLDSTEDEPRIKTDIEKTKRVFSNLIKNAVDAMPEGGKLAISSKDSDGNVEVIFVDTGIGMTKGVMEKLWTPFFTTKAKGMGLGLPICKRIIEAHGGRISVESTIGKGTTVKVTIPKEPKLMEKGGEKVWVNVPESLLSMTTKP